MTFSTKINLCWGALIAALVAMLLFVFIMIVVGYK
jgi:uncharacterized integral membrane protein